MRILKYLFAAILVAEFACANPTFYGLNQTTSGSTPAPTPDIQDVRFEEGSGTSAAGTVGAGFGTTIPSFTPNVWGRGSGSYGVTLAGSGAYMQSTPSLGGVSKMSLIVWMALANTSGFTTIIKSAGSFNQSGWEVNTSTGGTVIGARVWDSVGGQHCGEYITGLTPVTTLYCFGIVLDNSTSAGAVKWYVNGVAQSTTNYGSTHAVASTFVDNVIYVSQVGTSPITYLDHWQLFSGELSAAQFLAAYNDSLQPK